MSDLQIGLLAVGALVVVGVLAYNGYQERRARRAAERAFALPGEAPPLAKHLERGAQARCDDKQRDGQHGRDRVPHNATVNLVIWSFGHLVVGWFIDRK